MASYSLVERLGGRPQHSSIISVGRGLVCLRGVVAHHFGFSSRRPGFESRREHHDFQNTQTVVKLFSLEQVLITQYPWSENHQLHLQVAQV